MAARASSHAGRRRGGSASAGGEATSAVRSHASIRTARVDRGRRAPLSCRQVSSPTASEPRRRHGPVTHHRSARRRLGVLPRCRAARLAVARRRRGRGRENGCHPRRGGC
jgi:hypothetical protein